MDHATRSELLRQYLESIRGGEGGGLESLTTDVESTEGMSEGAVEATRALRDGGALTPQQREDLEALVLPHERPVAFVKNDTWDERIARFPTLNEPATRDRFAPLLRAVGRIDIPGLPTYPYAGTGFVVGDGLLLTNRHVAELFATGLAAATFLTESAGARVDFTREHGGGPQGDPFKVVAVLWIHPHWDAALLRVEGLAGRQPLTLLPERPEDLVGRDVAVVGYPARDWRNDLTLQDKVFGSVYQVKRLQPGKLGGAVETISFKHPVRALRHDASTLGGNSGSAIFDIATGQVLGLHFGGRYLIGNYAVPAYELALDRHVVDAGVRFARAVDGPADWLGAWGAEAPLPLPPGSTPGPTPTPNVAVKPTAPTEGVAARVLTRDWWERLDVAELRRIFEEDPHGAWAEAQRAFGPGEAERFVASVRPADGATEGVEAAAPLDGAPILVYLHGILGAHLRDTLGATHVWLDPWRAALTDIGPDLQLDESGTRDRGTRRLAPAGHLGVAYGLAARAWARGGGIDVRPFAFDWRKSIPAAADSLHAWLEQTLAPGQQVTIVAHSMGGLVAAAYAKAHPEWEARIKHAVFVGVPAAGAFAAYEAIQGTFPLLRKLALLTRSSPESLRRMCASFPGLVGMLPDPERFPAAARLYDPGAWDPRFAPPTKALDDARALKEVLATSPIYARTSLIVCGSFGTVDQLDAFGEGGVGPRTGRGDGTVPLASALVPGVPAWHAAGFDHSLLMNHPGVIAAVAERVIDDEIRSLPRIEAGAPIVTESVPTEAPGTPSGDGATIRARWEAGDVRVADIRWLLDSEPGPVVEVPGGAEDGHACDEEGSGGPELEIFIPSEVEAPVELSGAQWCARYPGSAAIEACVEPFASNLRAFVAALRAAGATVAIASTWRPPERAWLMHWAWRIAVEGLAPAEVPARANLPIQWVHATPEASVAAAVAMRQGYRMKFRAAITSRHTQGRGVDMRVDWTGVIQVSDKAGATVALDRAQGDAETNAALHALGATYGVKKLLSDPPHWSNDGR